jgi:hypothetical protein
MCFDPRSCVSVQTALVLVCAIRSVASRPTYATDLNLICSPKRLRNPLPCVWWPSRQLLQRCTRPVPFLPYLLPFPLVNASPFHLTRASQGLGWRGEAISLSIAGYHLPFLNRMPIASLQRLLVRSLRFRRGIALPQPLRLLITPLSAFFPFSKPQVEGQDGTTIPSLAASLTKPSGTLILSTQPRGSQNKTGAQVLV